VKEIRIYDITGKLVKTFKAEKKMIKAENYEIRWDLRDNNQKKVTAGIYFIEVTTNDGKAIRKEMRKIMVVK
jgi:flagellar hook assembly protein FlgD